MYTNGQLPVKEVLGCKTDQFRLAVCFSVLFGSALCNCTSHLSIVQSIFTSCQPALSNLNQTAPRSFSMASTDSHFTSAPRSAPHGPPCPRSPQFTWRLCTIEQYIHCSCINQHYPSQSTTGHTPPKRLLTPRPPS